MTGDRLPNLLVAGVPKAGTSSLFAYLKQHPEISPADEKEVGYFNYYNPLRHDGDPPSVETYARHFDHCKDETYRFEATPTYSYGGAPVISAIRRLLPGTKIIMSLRNPVDRLWSAYTFQRKMGNLATLKTFEEYVRACESSKRHAADLVPRDHMHGLYIGFYENYVGLWLEAFGADMKVVFLEDLARDPSAITTELFQWLGLDAEVATIDLVPRNSTDPARSTKVAKLVYSLKRSADQRHLVPSGFRGPLKRAYSQINTGGSSEKLEPEMARYVEALYRPSNAATAQALTSHGYHNLPSWLSSAAQGT